MARGDPTHQQPVVATIFSLHASTSLSSSVLVVHVQYLSAWQSLTAAEGDYFFYFYFLSKTSISLVTSDHGGGMTGVCMTYSWLATLARQQVV